LLGSIGMTNGNFFQ